MQPLRTYTEQVAYLHMQPVAKNSSAFQILINSSCSNRYQNNQNLMWTPRIFEKSGIFLRFLLLCFGNFLSSDI
jgi:hypothetical protein